jgi:nitrogen fixation protein FixH
MRETGMRDTAHGWKWAILGTVLLFVAALVVTMTLAVRTGTRVVDADYYDHGLHYDAVQGTDRSGGAARMQADASFTDGRLRMRLTDAAGAPVRGATVTFFPVAAAADVKPFALQEAEPGTYASSRLPGNGAVTGTITAVRGADSLRRRVAVLR